jgi:hypothetical protein
MRSSARAATITRTRHRHLWAHRDSMVSDDPSRPALSSWLRRRTEGLTRRQGAPPPTGAVYDRSCNGLACRFIASR